MKFLYKIGFSIAFLLVPLVGQSQDNTMFLLRSLPQNASINASVIPEGKGYIGFPALSSLQVDYYNSGFALKDILHAGTGTKKDSLVIDLNSFGNALSANNVYFQEVSNTLLAFGIRIKKSYITFAVNSKFKSEMYYPGTIGDIPKGNFNYNTMQMQTLTTEGTSFNAMAYNEIALGCAYTLNDKVTVGGRLKYILGAVNIKSDKFDIVLNTLSSTELQIRTDASIQTNLPLTIKLDSLKYVDSVSMNDSAQTSKMLNGNSGFGIDLGVTYKPIPRLSIGVAANDIGFIRWKNYPTKFISHSTFNYNGIDLSSMFGENTTNSDYWKQMEDSIKQSFKVSTDASSYSTDLQGNFILSGTFQMKKWLDLGAMVKTQFYQGRIYPSLGFACGLSPSKLFSSSISYSFRKGSYANVGVGFVFSPGPVQFYLVTDNIPAAFALEQAKAINFRFGINYILGAGDKAKKESKPSLPKAT